MRACQAAPIYFISTLIKRQLIATSLIMLQAAFGDVNGGEKIKIKGNGSKGDDPVVSRNVHVALMFFLLQKSTTCLG